MIRSNMMKQVTKPPMKKGAKKAQGQQILQGSELRQGRQG